MSAPLTGFVFWDKDADGLFNGVDVPLAGVTVVLSEAIYFNGFVGSAITDGGGYFSIDTTGLGSTECEIKCNLSIEWLPTIGSFDIVTPGPPYGVNQLFPATERCTRVASSWLKKVCFIAGQGVTVTFQSKRDIFTCYYPNTTMQDYLNLIQAASKGNWIHWFYEKARPYIPCQISP